MISAANKKVKDGVAKYVKGELGVEPATPVNKGGRKRKVVADTNDDDEAPTPTPTPRKKRSPRKKPLVKKEVAEGDGDSSGPGESLFSTIMCVIAFLTLEIDAGEIQVKEEQDEANGEVI